MMDGGETLLGGVPLRAASARGARLSMLLWGDAGCGKTTLAATAPGKKLFVQFDPDGSMSIANRSDVQVLDLSPVSYLQVIEKFRADDPYGLESFLKTHPDIETVVWDSVTSFAYRALQEAVSRNKNSSMEVPGQHGYVWANANVLRAAQGLISMTGRLNRNVIFITHERRPDANANGTVTGITMMIGKSPANQIGLRLNEVWWMSDTGKERKIAVRPTRDRSPMKTRMWQATASEFTWRYDANKQEGDGIATWFAAWQKQDGEKLPLPK